MGRCFKWIILLLYILLLVIAGISLALFFAPTCFRKSCISRGLTIRAAMDTSVDPCKDFYKFSCGNIQNVLNYARDRRPGDYLLYPDDLLDEPFRDVNLFAQFDTAVREYQYRFARLTYEKIDEHEIEVLFKTLTASCSHVWWRPRDAGSWGTVLSQRNFLVQSRELLMKINYFRYFIRDKFANNKFDGERRIVNESVEKEDPIPSNFVEDKFSVERYESILRKQGFFGQSLFRYYVAPDIFQGNKLSLFIEPPREVTPFFVKTRLLFLETDYAKDVLVLMQFLFNMFDKYINDKMTSIISDFEKQLMLGISDKPTLIKRFKPIKIEELNKIVPFIDWKQIVRIVVPDKFEPKNIFLLDSNYFYNLQNAIENIERYPKYTVALYMTYRTILDLGGFVFTAANADATKNIQTKSIVDCESLLLPYFGGAIRSILIEKFNIETGGQNDLKQMFYHERKVIKKYLEDAQWLDSKTKVNVLAKLNNLKETISVDDTFFKEMKNIGKRDRYFEEFCFNKDLFHGIIRGNRFLMQGQRNSFENGISGFAWFDDDLPYNNFFKLQYNSLYNEFLVPVSLARNPLYSTYWPMALNFGAIGVYMARELLDGLGFMSTDRDIPSIDGGGFLTDNSTGHPTGFWEEETFKNYVSEREGKMHTCGNYTHASNKNKKYFGIRENDIYSSTKTLEPYYLMAMQLTSKAFREYRKSLYLRETIIPGLEGYTNDQLFFMGFANLHCLTYNDKDIFTLNSSKIVNVVSEMDAFNDAFKCKASQKEGIDKCMLSKLNF